MVEQEDKKSATKDPNRTGDKTHMHVKVYAPFKTYYNGLAESISAENPTGPFDILASHYNFMTLLSPCEIVVRNDGKEEKMKIQRGIMHVKKDAVIVFLDV